MGKKREDLTGKVFNRLTAIEGFINEKGYLVWKCRCECGKEVIVYPSNLRNGSAKSCGCHVIVDFTGKVFGKLTTIEFVEKDSKGVELWKCKCECGNEVVKKKPLLVNGKTTTCGCYKPLIEDLTGKVFERLTVIEFAGMDKVSNISTWKCKCECGEETIVRRSNLTTGKTRSCGCLLREKDTLEDLTGEVFGRLTVLKYAGFDSKNKVAKWKCKCECGEIIITRKQGLKNGTTRSCGCLQRDTIGSSRFKHGLYNHRMYGIWGNMRDRCNNPNNAHYQSYGGRGIKVCDEWDKDFEAFYRDMIDTYKDELTLDRKDVNGDYSPENCRWATMMEQGNNRRNNNFITVFGEKLSIAQAARKYNMVEHTLRDRVKRGLTPEEAVTKKSKPTITVFGEELTFSQAAKKYGLQSRTISDRIKRGLTPEEAVTLQKWHTGQEKKK